MFHTKGPIFKVFRIIPSCCCCLWGYSEVSGPSVRASRLLARAKDTGSLCPIFVGEMFFQLISNSIVL
jgi:hypothetical protein